MVRRGYIVKTVLAIMPIPMVFRCRMVIRSDTLGSRSPVSSTIVFSISSTIRLPSSSRPWMKSQRGLSGTYRRTSSTPTPRMAPNPNASRQP